MRATRCFRDLPRIVPNPKAIPYKVFRDKFECVPAGRKSRHPVVIRGRVTAKRSAGQQLFFLDTQSAGHKIQAIANDTTANLMNGFKSLSKGDFVELTGVPGRAEHGELSIYTTNLVRLSHCHHRIPEQYTDYVKRMNNRHIDFIVNQASRQKIIHRSKVISALRRELDDRGFLELETPILQSSASGAAARPFETKSILGLDLQLKIAPELALKRAVIGGFEKVYEIGKSFRNEGLSKRHNPEFTTCEFYQAYAGLEDLMELTEALLIVLQSVVSSKTPLFAAGAFKRLSFVPTIEKAIGRPLPADTESLVTLFTDLDLAPPADLSLANLYDALSTKYIEPLCQAPTFVTDLPAVLSPLAKSTDGISHRFELYVNKMELANAYEEENDPDVQRQKFRAQNNGSLTPDEEDYCKALEWGLPPTGGFGMGIDRLIMLLTHSARINETLLAGGIMHQPRAKSASETASEP